MGELTLWVDGKPQQNKEPHPCRLIVENVDGDVICLLVRITVYLAAICRLPGPPGPHSLFIAGLVCRLPTRRRRRCSLPLSHPSA